MPHELFARPRILPRVLYDVSIGSIVLLDVLPAACVVEERERGLESGVDGVLGELVNVRKLHARLLKERHSLTKSGSGEARSGQRVAGQAVSGDAEPRHCHLGFFRLRSLFALCTTNCKRRSAPLRTASHRVTKPRLLYRTASLAESLLSGDIFTLVWRL